MRRADLPLKWWYRLIKVIFIIAFSLAAIGVNTAVITAAWPDKYVDYAKSSIVCHSTYKEYNLASNSLFLDISDSLSDVSKKRAIDLCMTDEEKAEAADLEERYKAKKLDGLEVREFNLLFNRYEAPNYILHVEKYQKNGEWIGLLFAAFVGFGITAAIFFGIKWMFFYVVCGKENVAN